MRIYEVANAAGVSTATVSRALRGLPDVSEETRRTVRRIADELGYVASSSASGLASGRTLAIGVVVSSFTAWFESAVLEGIDSELRSANYDLVLYQLGTDPDQRERVFGRSLQRKRTDALLSLCMDFTTDERQQLASDDLPTIVVGGHVKGLRSIGIDETRTATSATNHLIELGHRDIVHLNGSPDTVKNPLVPKGRHKGYEHALRAAGIPVNPERQIFGDFSLAKSREVMNEVFSSPTGRPTAVFASSDEMAIGAILAAWDRGLRVPDDVSILGIDGHPLGESFGLTTFAQDPTGQGVSAVTALLDQLGGATPAVRLPIAPTEFLLRTTTAVAPR